MPRTWLLIDVHYLAYRSYHTTGHMAYKDRLTGVAYGLLAELLRLEDHFSTRHVAFAFDAKSNARKLRWPWYKISRPTDPDSVRTRREVAEQVDALRHEYLPLLGYKNLFYEDGYEADDLIAAAVAGLGGRENAVMVSSDRDLYQLLGPGVSQFKPGPRPELVEEANFRNQYYGISPFAWPKVKSIAGCESDDVPGIEGVGEAMASRFLAGKMPDHWAVHPMILKWVGSRAQRESYECCKLPYKGCPAVAPRVHAAPTENAWDELCGLLGFEGKPGMPKLGHKDVRAGISR